MIPFVLRLLDRYSWDERRVCELYRRSVERRKELGVEHVKREIVEGKLTVDQLPFAEQVKQVISINGISSLEKVGEVAEVGSADTDCLIDGKVVKYGNVIGCYEMRYGHGKGMPLVDAADQNAASPLDLQSLSLADDPSTETPRVGKRDGLSSWSNWWLGTGTTGGSAVSEAASLPTSNSELTPAQFTRYMVYVTQWRWLQCEDYIRCHGELGFWSMIHDCSCPQGYVSLWTRMRSLLGQYMPPVEEAWCASYAGRSQPH